MTVYRHIQEALAYIGQKSTVSPEVGVVLGSGLGEFAHTAADPKIYPYADIPHFKGVGVEGHAGRLVLGRVGNKNVAILQGRCHYYEGHHINEVVFPVRVLCGLGVKKILLTNAAGGISPSLEPGDLMLIRDHINLMGTNPLRGANDDRLGPRFPDMSDVYDKEIIEIMKEEMKSLGLKVSTGIYAALGGPSYETPAEIKMLAALGADAVGMSTIPEAIAARHMGARVAGISCISNLAAGISKKPLDHKEVTETADRVKNRFIDLLNKIIPRL